MKRARVDRAGFGACQGCGLHATLRTLDVAVRALPARGGAYPRPAAPAGWCPLIALCGMCWTEVVQQFRELATPDAAERECPICPRAWRAKP